MFRVFGFYKFIKIKFLKKNKIFLQKFLTSNNVKGTIIIAKEGLNGTISGRVKDINKTTKKLKSLFSFKLFDNSNESKSKFQPFHKPKIKIKKEIVSMNLTINSKDRNMETHLEPKDWNKLIKNKDTHIIDTRKPFEYEVDTFKKKCLMEGLDDIALSMEKISQIDNFEKRLIQDKPWLIKND